MRVRHVPGTAERLFVGGVVYDAVAPGGRFEVPAEVGRQLVGWPEWDLDTEPVTVAEETEPVAGDTEDAEADVEPSVNVEPSNTGGKRGAWATAQDGVSDMGASYATAAEIATALDLPEFARLAAGADAGATELALDRPADIAPGALLLVGYGAAAPEQVLVAGLTESSVLLATPLAGVWPAGTRLLDLTPLDRVAEAASRLVDDLTYTPREGFAYAEVEEVHNAVADRDGNVTVTVDRYPVREVLEFRYQEVPWLPEWSAPINEVWWDDDDYVVRAWISGSVPATPGRRVRVKIRYRGGFQPDELPADIRRATIILAARLWKEKDSGYSDVIGSPDFGLLQYREAAPKDVLAMLQRWRRVVAT